uniref:Uncharacterized protein n=1 Tax=Melopsittacus undulatus TaxID=13146 RepID=A0A8C6J0S2_MELUD
ISGSKSSRDLIPEIGAALFNKPTSSSNSVANTEEGNLIDGALDKETKNNITIYLFSVSPFEFTFMKMCRQSHDHKKLCECLLSVKTSLTLLVASFQSYALKAR